MCVVSGCSHHEDIAVFESLCRLPWWLISCSYCDSHCVVIVSKDAESWRIGWVHQSLTMPGLGGCLANKIEANDFIMF